ncbi:MAG: peptidoglycan hydrolase [Pseudonocardiaceae bacterium]|nr:peptidoglycan hydrolase [Pseudonocardiaceae bacterium]
MRAAVVLLCELLVLAMVPPAAGLVSGPTRPHTIAALPHWNLGHGADSVLSRGDTFTEVTPWLYGVEEDGTIQRQPSATAGSANRHLERLRAAGLSIVPSIANVSGGTWNAAPVRRILHDPSARTAHVRDIVELVRSRGYDGIDIDYEELRSTDRAAFTRMLTELADGLHAMGKRLSVDVFAKTTDAGYDERNKAQDYAAIGQVADQVRLMAYDYHWQTSAPGPVAPIGWVADVLDYATSQIPPEKIVLGVPMYGYDWARGRASPITWLQAFGRSRKFNAKVHWDGFSESPRLRYTDDQGVEHELWFENAYSASAKFDLARRYSIGGVFLWLFGPEDDFVWTKLGRHWRPSDPIEIPE